MVILMFWGQKLNCPTLKLSIFVVHKMLIEHEEEDIQVNFKREIN